jgi:hypothetical protein
MWISPFLKDFTLRSNMSCEMYLFDRFDFDNPDNGDDENVGGRVQREKILPMLGPGITN